jgi:hypothetical protein
MKVLIEFLRRNLLLILFLCLIVGQLLIWRQLVAIQEHSGDYTCGRSEHPCYVIAVPNAR